jgi:WD40 repeat protein
MPESPSVEHLVTRWHVARQQGQSLSAEDLCADQPDLLDELKRRLRDVAAMKDFLQLTQESHSGESSSEQPTLAQIAGPSLSAPAAEMPGLPGYEILSELGRGGMGVVFKARQLALGREVALKMVLHGALAGPEAMLRFLREAELIARLRHPNIVQVYDFGTRDDKTFFSMELLEGGSLSQRHPGEPQAPAPAAGTVELLARAMQAAHEQGIVHRDLKPGNVLLDAQGIPKVTDFGLARQSESHLTATGAVLGTPSYMAPEQAAGLADVGPAVDIWGLGAILYEQLTGRPPFRGASAWETIQMVLGTDPVPPSRLNPLVPHDLEVICLACLQKSPQRRYPTARDLADDLRHFLANEPIKARPIGAAERLRRWVRRNPVVAGLLAAVAASVLAGLAGVLHFAFGAERARVIAEQARGDERDARIHAQRSASELRRGLVRQHLVLGTQRLEAADRDQALWEFAQAWNLDESEDTAHRLRLGFTLQGGPQLAGICFHRRPVLDAIFHPDGKTILTRTDERKVYQWNPFTSEQTVAPLVHPAAVTAAFFTPDGERIVTGSADGNVRLWEARTGKLLRTLAQPGPVLALALRGKDRLLAVATQTGKVAFWSLRDGRPGGESLDLPAAVYHVAFSSDGTKLVTADASHAARVWEVATGKCLTSPLPHQDLRSQDEVAIHYRCWPVLSPDGSALATAFPNEESRADLSVHDLNTGKERFARHKYKASLRQFRFHPGGDFVAFAGDTGNLYDSRSGRDLPGVFDHPRESPHSCFSPDSKILATCSTGGLIHVFDFATRKERAQPMRCGDGVHSVVFSPDGGMLLAASHDGTARVIRVAASDNTRPLSLAESRHERFVSRSGSHVVQYSPDGKRCVYSGPDGVYLCDPDATDKVRVDHLGKVKLVRFQPDGRCVLLQDDQFTLRLFDARTGTRMATPLRLNRGLIALAFSADGQCLLTVESANAEKRIGPVVTVWEMATGKPLLGPLHHWETGPQAFGDKAWAGQISRAALSPDGRRLVLASNATSALGVLDVPTGQPRARVRGFRGVLYGMRFSRDGESFLTHSSDGVARLWRTEDCTPAGPPLQHPAFCRKASLAPDGDRVVTAASDSVIRLWDGRTGDLLGRIEGWPQPQKNGVWFSRDGRALIIFDGKTWRMLDLPVYQGKRDDLPVLLRLLTGVQRAIDGTIEPIDRQLFLTDADTCRRAWLAWRGHGVDSARAP